MVERDAAAYLASMLEELASLAQNNGLPVLAYLLDMALAEAKAVADPPGIRGDGRR